MSEVKKIATRTEEFKKVFPERHIDCGIAEANMVGIAAGLSTCGYVPFVTCFAMFLAGRAFEQIRNAVGYPQLNVKFGATYGGISVGEDGATHQCNKDIALMRTIPEMVILNLADSVEAAAAVKATYEHKGPVYLRFGRLAIPVFNEEETYDFQLGKGIVLRDGEDCTIIATGLCVSEALIIGAAQKTKRIFTVEEHSVIGGLGSAVADVLGENCPTKLTKIGIKDIYGHSGSANVLLHEAGLDAEGIAGTVLANI